MANTPFLQQDHLSSLGHFCDIYPSNHFPRKVAHTHISSSLSLFLLISLTKFLEHFLFISLLLSSHQSFSSTPPLSEVILLWDFVLSFGVTVFPLCLAARVILLRDKLMVLLSLSLTHTHFLSLASLSVSLILHFSLDSPSQFYHSLHSPALKATQKPYQDYLQSFASPHSHRLIHWNARDVIHKTVELLQRKIDSKGTALLDIMMKHGEVDMFTELFALWYETEGQS